MSKWKWVLVLLLFLTLSAPVTIIADTEGSDDADQPTEVDQEEGGDEGTGDAPVDDDPADDDPAGDDPADDDPADDDPADDDPADDDIAVQEPSYKNAAQAMHAANLAAAAALQPDQKTLDAADDLRSARDEYEDAKAAWDENPDDMELQETYELAEGELIKARETYANAIGNLSGVLTSDISQMRQSGMGWGRIAHELGVHPGALGLARGKKQGPIAQPLDPVEGEVEVENTQEIQAQYTVQNEIAEATQRDRKGGWSQGHGLKTSKSGSSKKGLGLSESSATAQTSSGVKGNSSKGSKGSSSKSTSSTDSSAKSNNSRASDGGPSKSGNSNGASSSNNSKAKDKSDKSNNGKANGKNK